MQFLRGYCILLSEPVVPSINHLAPPQRAQFLSDMVLIGDAIMEVTGAYRINYAVLGNSEPVLHAHIVPRYSSEPDDLRCGLPWSYAQEVIDNALFDPDRDEELKAQLASAIQNHTAAHRPANNSRDTLTRVGLEEAAARHEEDKGRQT